MNVVKGISKVSYIVIFVLAIIGIGVISIANLSKFYIYDEINNNEWTPELGSKFETDFAMNLYQKNAFIDFNGAMRRVTGQHEMNGVIRLNNNYLMTTIPYASDEYLDNCADNISELNRFLEQKKISLVYASTPYTLSKYDSQLPIGVEDYGNDNVDKFLEKLSENNVDVIDFRERIYEDGLNQYEMMFKTDHHWKPETGLYAYKILESYIEEKLDLDMDDRISNLDYYEVTEYKNCFLGSRGQRTGKFFGGLDDYELIVPKFETSIENGKGEQGKLQEIVIDMDAIQENDLSARYMYDNVLGNSMGYHKNLLSNNDLNILIITDSFGKAVNPYLILASDNLLAIGYTELSFINSKKLEEFNPDVVIILYYPDILRDSYQYKGFDFSTFYS